MAGTPIGLNDASVVPEYDVARRLDPSPHPALHLALRGRAVIAENQSENHSLPDATVTPESEILGPDVAVTENTFAGTHTGPLRTPTGEIPATRRQVRMRQVLVQQVTDGLISSEHLYSIRSTSSASLGSSKPASRVDRTGARPRERHPLVAGVDDPRDEDASATHLTPGIDPHDVAVSVE